MNRVTHCRNCWTPVHHLPGTGFIRCTSCGTAISVAEPQSLPSPNRGPGGSLPSPHGKKRALIVGISYWRAPTPGKLKGSVNDAKYMRHLLKSHFGFPDSSILLLTDEETDPYKIPTKQNLRMALIWLVQGCQPGDSLFFHFSGHGSQQRDYNGDEVDGYDETLCPLDFETQGMILDDEINATIIRPLPHGVKLHATIDSCCSGTVLDLPFVCKINRSGQCTWEDHRPQNGNWKGTNGGEAISFSGCDDNQMSFDSKVSMDTKAGLMTYHFIQAIEQGYGATYGSILNFMQWNVRNKTDRMAANYGGFSKQDPQLTSNNVFDVYKKPFSL